MKRNVKTALGVIATLGIALGASAVAAHPDRMGNMEGGMGQHGPMSGAMHGSGGMAGQQLMTPQERDALREKMAAAKTPEERQALAAATHADMEKRAKEQGIALPAHRGPHGAMGAQQGPGSKHRH
ncbi:hypothetical protein [Hydrogenophaga sp. BPS33]|uniref:hypothetical protein n=1 Tax=Hydrogenophaga sp. BPS33 TaxID=2651974 RepID=UPI0013204582|nr:hypothetical protein [Hydrogenophaga sp. BPS33]QHE86213.1 hypothetical protein F9K07_15515 [Hydrogenophaga sp. BPS33]